MKKAIAHGIIVTGTLLGLFMIDSESRKSEAENVETLYYNESISDGIIMNDNNGFTYFIDYLSLENEGIEDFENEPIIVELNEYGEILEIK